jgi:hypothetical protein
MDLDHFTTFELLDYGAWGWKMTISMGLHQPGEEKEGATVANAKAHRIL